MGIRVFTGVATGIYDNPKSDVRVIRTVPNLGVEGKYTGGMITSPLNSGIIENTPTEPETAQLAGETKETAKQKPSILWWGLVALLFL